jgi:hypothetical protein
MAVLTVAPVVLLFSSLALACLIDFEPATVRVDGDGRASFDALIHWEHRRCVLDDDDVNIDAKGVKVLRQSGWQKVKRGLYKNRLDIQLTAQEGSLRIWRECSKKGISDKAIRVIR